MNAPETASERVSFIVHTVLGYLSLLLHHSVFAPQLAEDPTAIRVVLVVINLAAGTWCFLRALRSLWRTETAWR